MLSKAKIKWIKSLQLKKYRHEEQSFVVQGLKGVTELLSSSFTTILVAGTDSILKPLRNQFGQFRHIEWYSVTPTLLESVGSFQSNDVVLAVAQIKDQSLPEQKENEFILALDDIRDPGNLGTIIRTADWFGIKTMVASVQTADFYNPKTISATMGSFCRVRVSYTDLVSYLKEAKVPIYGAFLSGRDIHHQNFGQGGIIVIGNESKGISSEVGKHIRNRIFIPGSGNAESLNAAIATGIILDNIFRLK